MADWRNFYSMRIYSMPKSNHAYTMASSTLEKQRFVSIPSLGQSLCSVKFRLLPWTCEPIVDTLTQTVHHEPVLYHIQNWLQQCRGECRQRTNWHFSLEGMQRWRLYSTVMQGDDRAGKRLQTFWVGVLILVCTNLVDGWEAAWNVPCQTSPKCQLTHLLMWLPCCKLQTGADALKPS